MSANLEIPPLLSMRSFFNVLTFVNTRASTAAASSSMLLQQSVSSVNTDSVCCKRSKKVSHPDGVMDWQRSRFSSLSLTRAKTAADSSSILFFWR